jgi:hypothetical protein
MKAVMLPQKNIWDRINRIGYGAPDAEQRLSATLDATTCGASAEPISAWFVIRPLTASIRTSTSICVAMVEAVRCSLEYDPENHPPEDRTPLDPSPTRIFAQHIFGSLFSR